MTTTKIANYSDKKNGPKRCRPAVAEGDGYMSPPKIQITSLCVGPLYTSLVTHLILLNKYINVKNKLKFQLKDEDTSNNELHLLITVAGHPCVTQPPRGSHRGLYEPRTIDAVDSSAAPQIWCPRQCHGHIDPRSPGICPTRADSLDGLTVRCPNKTSKRFMERQKSWVCDAYSRCDGRTQVPHSDRGHLDVSSGVHKRTTNDDRVSSRDGR